MECELGSHSIVAIPCEACRQPVHSTSVVCPHCGERTGRAPDEQARTQVKAIQVLGAMPRQPEVEPLLERLSHEVSRADDGGGIELLDAIGAIADLIAPKRDDATNVPRAVARTTRK